jgi:sugar lactone lactonase YvrE
MGAGQVAPFGSPGHFYECPRWRADRWWVSDMRGRKVYSFTADGAASVELELGDRPGGLGWTRDGDLLVVSMEAKALLQIAPEGRRVSKAFDLTHLVAHTPGFLNDLVTSSSGHVYIGFNSDLDRDGHQASLGRILHVTSEGAAGVAAEGLPFPNGMVISPDGSTLIVADTMSSQFRGFPIQRDGSLGEAFTWAALDPRKDMRARREPPLTDSPARLDGCAIDAEGHIWAADLVSGCFRIAPGGAVVDAVFLPDGLRPIACAVGGPDGRTLLICGADDNYRDRELRRDARLFTARVDVPAP